MWGNINRHLTVSWQAVAVVAGSFVLFFGLAERPTISLDAAVAMMLILVAFQLCHVYDANTWFNRNLEIVSNIERQFLTIRVRGRMSAAGSKRIVAAQRARWAKVRAEKK
jgi:predicted signal transduction protein with EAL and GGDEF domain